MLLWLEDPDDWMLQEEVVELLWANLGDWQVDWFAEASNWKAVAFNLCFKSLGCQPSPAGSWPPTWPTAVATTPGLASAAQPGYPQLSTQSDGPRSWRLPAQGRQAHSSQHSGQSGPLRRGGQSGPLRHIKWTEQGRRAGGRCSPLQGAGGTSQSQVHAALL
jgi:hypothetical protein